ncbi:hypothetical protein Q5424_12665 [Conexibacter sp. JD483]|uniref:TolB family protein n=1 Tax=unclassified Conexibacter TaxID=2627773 RepID=UPI00272772E2|nr:MULTISPECIES: hypothetical protein [unclassified Conexibacter]MDO8186880.1 hypothetical protein [Conexibacter sp. CPCC 205706]MDO8200808.1 hypothetical protein [Conexibacter sp. CPCC 205762]MDR9369944.1 hypothetical protein [Conexibacter sp. JD483]
MRRAFAGLLTAGAVAASVGALAPSAGAAGNALELASPLRSEGFNVVGAGWPDGNHAAFKQGLIDANARYGARNADGSWSYGTLEPVEATTNANLLDAADDFSTKIVYEAQMFLRAGEPETLWVQNPDGSKSTIAEWELADPFAPAADQRTARYSGRSADGRTLYVNASTGLLDAPDSSDHLYRWHDGELSPVELGDTRPDEFACKNAVIGGSYNPYVSQGQEGVSDDGETIVAALPYCFDSNSVEHPPELYAWNADGDAVLLNRPYAGAPAAGAEFRGLSADGGTVFFTSAGKLTADDDNGFLDLFAVDTTTGAVTRLSGGSADRSGIGSTIVAAGGGAVWFASPRPVDGQGTSGRGNLFRWTPQGGAKLLLQTPSPNDLNFQTSFISGASELSYDGTAMALVSTADLTPDASGSQKIYRIDASGAIDCVSCRPDGRAVGGGTRLTPPPASNGVYYGVPSISADGSKIVFETSDALVPQDQNGRFDAYLWQGGESTLLSTGTQPADANAAGISLDGGTAYFSSFGALLPNTRDTFSKLYAVRLGATPPPQGPAPCADDACQGPGTPVPVTPNPASESFEGSGNVIPALVRSFAPTWPGKSALGALARRGTLVLTVTGSDAGTVGATVQARIGGAWVQVGSASKTMAKGRVKLTLKLSRKARKQLAAGRSLRIRVTVRAARVAGQRSATFTLRGTRTAKAERVVRR